MNLTVLKKNGQIEEFNNQKIIDAITKSAKRIDYEFTKGEYFHIVTYVLMRFQEREEPIVVAELHEAVEDALKKYAPQVAVEYVSYRGYKKRFNKAFDNILMNSKSIIYDGSKENANKDSQLISTKKELVSGTLSKELYLEYELPKDIAEAHISGGMYIHDTGDRLFGSINCCLFDMATLLKGGFNLNGVKYTEPKTVESAIRVLSDVILQASSQQYGGFTLAEIDNVLEPYVEKSLNASKKYYREKLNGLVSDKIIENLAYSYVERNLEQGFQALETRLNSINNANGQTAFIAFTFGLNTTKYGRMINKTLLENRMKGIGENGITPVFPKLAFLHRNGINGQLGDKNFDLYILALKCSMVSIYPDFLSLNSGYLGEMFDKYGLAVSQMGCRAYLAPYYVKGGFEPLDDTDYPVFIGRANCGAVTLNTVRYAIEAKGDKAKYFELLDIYFEKAVRVHLLTYEKLCKIKASSNPLFFCEGGCHIKLDPNESIQKAIDTFTWSFGYIGLNEASLLMIGKEIHEDNSFAIEVLEYLNKRTDEAKDKYGMMFAVYGTPAESLAHTFRNKDFAKYGLIKGVTDKEYYMNSFHVNVKAQINGIEKQRIESPMFHLSKGGRITYNEFPNITNLEGYKALVDNAMLDGKYFGGNFELDFCNVCGFKGEFTDYKCTECGSEDITMIDRVCGYVSYRKLNGDTRYNKGKYEEVEHRVDHFGIPVELGD